MVSNAISENTIPAVSKMLEQYILAYMHDDYLSIANKAVGSGPRPTLRYKFKRGKLIGEAYDHPEMRKFDPKDFDYSVSSKDVRNQVGRGLGRGAGDVKDALKKRIKRGTKDPELDPSSPKFNRYKYKDYMDRVKLGYSGDKNRRDQEKHDKDMKVKGVKVSVKTYDQGISLEPTYITVETEEYGTRMLGIKVVPYRVQSDAKLSALLMHDMKIKGITAATLPLGRKVMGKIWRTARMKGHITGDPKQDIIYRTTGHKGQTFVALEKNHDIDEYFLMNTKKIKRLFKLGWGNFAICDDALQLAHFCLRANKGMCQAMSYRMMYNTLKQDNVYTDLEDMRKQNSSIFKVSNKRFSKLIGEAKADGKLFNYQERQ
jgi:hypothetical protein